MNEFAHAKPPARFDAPGPLSAVLFAAFLAFFVWSLAGAGISISELIGGLPNMARIGAEMVPPATDRLLPMLQSVLVTFQMAVVGTVLGIAFSVPLAVLASRNHTPHPSVRGAVRAVISFMRTVPDLAWALFFVASVGLGPFAGALTLIVDTIGFCGRFFAEAMEEVDSGPPEAMAAIGAGPLDIIACATLPMALPSLINTSLFALEKAVRSSVVLGLVGAGGIGAELATSMEMFRYDQAATIILMIFALVVVVEQLSSRVRARLIGGRG
ncbi:MAG TPA: phosphonate ABC transporter, permease protein PhnE [Candidatus Competibacter sp.]|nr:phosphonate ABC transporter, permease protein PhnE [Candidatus Competibacteraceae bacterium]HRE55148.1 phosphonate ABC transporter, permease protein PhnE [Candidatus Competibacter sp.]HUM95584.1 phosphonate ABC transporter, permease protein PhnE [Candidatus Competibacter sp.]